MDETSRSDYPPDLSPDPSMPSHALGSPVIQKIRNEVPEFEETFQASLLDEDGEMGSMQAMSTFASWVLARQAADPQAPEVGRSYAVIEDFTASNTGRELVAEFVEVIISHPDAVGRLGSATRSRYVGSA